MAQPKRYAPACTRHGLQAAKITRATAMKPRPAIMFSNQALAYAVASAPAEAREHARRT